MHKDISDKIDNDEKSSENPEAHKEKYEKKYKDILEQAITHRKDKQKKTGNRTRQFGALIENIQGFENDKKENKKLISTVEYLKDQLKEWAERSIKNIKVGKRYFHKSSP